MKEMSLNIIGTLLAASLFITLQIGRVVAILNLAAIFNIFESHLRNKKIVTSAFNLPKICISLQKPTLCSFCVSITLEKTIFFCLFKAVLMAVLIL